MDEGAREIAYDESDEGNDGVIFGASWVNGKYEKALDFDGYTDFVQTPPMSLNLLESAFTFEAWVYPRWRASDPSYASWVLVAKFSSIGISIGRRGEPNFAVNAWVSGNAVTFGTYPCQNWYHIVAVYTGFGSSERKIYVNGVYVGTDTGGAAADFSGNITIGNMTYTSAVYGVIDDVSIYNRALNEAEIKVLFTRKE